MPLESILLWYMFYTGALDSSLPQSSVLAQSLGDGLANSLPFVLPFVGLAIALAMTGSARGVMRIALGVTSSAYVVWALWPFGWGLFFLPTAICGVAAVIVRKPPPDRISR